METFSPKVSVIVPIYNAEIYLRRCVDSILMQTFNDFELLLIDDGSTDGSGKICDEYAAKDNRVGVYHKLNGGVSSARNMGLNNASGELVAFVDADDTVTADYLMHLVDCMNDSVDLVVSYAYIYKKDGSVKKEEYPSRIVDDSNFEILFVENDMHWHTSPWGKLYKRGVISSNNLLFCDGMHICEDAVFNFRYMLLCKNIFISGKTDYCYYVEVDNSLTKRINSVDSELLVYKEVAKIISKMIEEKHFKNPRALANLSWVNATNMRRVLNSLYYTKCNKSRRLQVLKNENIGAYADFKSSREPLTERIYKFLLANRLIRLYDCLRWAVANFRITN